jgi:hypothetical protein
LPSRRGVEVWMADATSGRTLARQLVVDEQPQGPDQTLVALQTAEILRTGLFPQTPNPPPPLPPSTPHIENPKVVAHTSPRSSETGVQAGLGGLYSSGGTGTALQAWLSVERRWRHGFGVALDLSLPVVRGSVSGPEGSANVAAYTAGLELFAIFPPRESHWFITTGLGGGVVDVRAVGSGKGALDGTTSSTLVGHGYARVEVAWHPATWALVAVSGLAGTTFESVTIRFAGNQAGSWGGVLLASFLHAGITWE